MSRWIVCAFIAFQFFVASAAAQSCPARPQPGSTVPDPTAVYSQSGVLTAGLTIENYLSSGFFLYCYAYQTGIEAPTLRANPGDKVNLTLTNQIQQGFSQKIQTHTAGTLANSECNGVMTSSSSNLHFHGLNVPPKCHQDETLFTLINPGDAPFPYQFAIPTNEPPGLYWYHPHPHGMTEGQVLGGASGAFIVEGIEKVKPEVAGLTERVFVLRDQANGPMTINFVPTSPGVPVISTGASEKQFWRILNAEGAVFVKLQIKINGVPQILQVVAVDGTPLKIDYKTTSIELPPAGRAEFVVQGPSAGGSGTLSTLGVNTGLKGISNPPQLIANIVPEGDARQSVKIPGAPADTRGQRLADLSTIPPATTRSLYFSEYLSSSGDSQFYITVQGQKPKFFEPGDAPAIVTKQGSVEDWTIENRSEEIHAFHIHQLHFLVAGMNGVPLKNTYMADTIAIPGWSGKGVYPSVTLRMDFRYPDDVGTFVYHCHILYHEDNGMMAKIQVLPAN